MNFIVFKPYSLMFYTTLLLGIFISLSSNNWFTIWMGLELNMYSFIPLLLQSNNNQEKEAAIKYFIIQALASGILLTASLILSSLIAPMCFLISLMMKIALAPCHFWFPTVMNSLSWNMCWMLTTLQKITPLYLLLQITQTTNTFMLSFVSAISAMTGAIGGLKQTQLRAILAYSSIAHLGWMTSSMHVSFSAFNLYLLSYIFMVSSIMYLLHKNQMNSTTPSMFSFTNNLFVKSYLPLSLLSLGGLPPLFGFFPKLLVLFSLLQNNFILLPFILIFSSTINLYYYLKIVFLSLIQAPSTNLISMMHQTYLSILSPSLFILATTLGLLSVILFY